YVVIAVSDTGCGMDAATRARIFEPFFTTKEVGKGTGLGLSTCYGIVKQSNGYICVSSEVGKGTVFKVYLPRVEGTASAAIRRVGGPERSGHETVLVVEDDARVRAAVTRILEGRGYEVVTAGDGRAAIAAAASHGGPIHLILSDVVMPGASGPEVVTEV